MRYEQKLTQEYASKLCDTPDDLDEDGRLRHDECACPDALVTWYREVMAP